MVDCRAKIIKISIAFCNGPGEAVFYIHERWKSGDLQSEVERKGKIGPHLANSDDGAAGGLSIVTKVSSRKDASVKQSPGKLFDLLLVMLKESTQSIVHRFGVCLRSRPSHNGNKGNCVFVHGLFEGGGESVAPGTHRIACIENGFIGNQHDTSI